LRLGVGGHGDRLGRGDELAAAPFEDAAAAAGEPPAVAIGPDVGELLESGTATGAGAAVAGDDPRA
jgi:hypothetical protein